MSETDLESSGIPKNTDPGALADEWAAALQEQQAAADKLAQNQPSPRTGSHNFDHLSDSSAGDGPKDINLDVILDVPVTIAIEVGRKRLNIRNLLQLTQGSLIELDRLQGEPMDVLVNGTLVAHGEVVVVNDKFGVRLTDVLSPSERVKKLK